MFNKGYNLIFFFPRSFSEGCTVQAQEFNQLHDQYDELGIRIIGISKCNQQLLDKFKLEHAPKLSFISDTYRLCEKLNLIVQKKDKTSIRRSTFLYKDGILLKSWLDTEWTGGAQIILDDIKQNLIHT